jgi:hypothetical protein
MASWAILQHLNRRGPVNPGRGKGGGMRGYVVLGAIDDDAWFGLGALTPDQAAKQVFPNAPRSPNAGHNMATFDQIVASAQAGRMVGPGGRTVYVPGTADCSATGQSGNVKLAQISGQMALTGLNVAAMTSATVLSAVGGAVILGAATLGIGAIIGLFPLLFGHHAAAVRKEQSILCAAVPAANNYLAIIDDAVNTGKATPQAAIQALSSLLSDFDTQVAPIRRGTDPNDAGECNAACVMSTELKAVVLLKQSQYQDLAAKSTPAMTSGSGPTSTPAVASGSTLQIPQSAAAAAASSSPNWMGIAALVAIGYVASRFL